jgi:hypothetical protein
VFRHLIAGTAGKKRTCFNMKGVVSDLIEEVLTWSCK